MNRQRVQTKLIELAYAGTFYTVGYTDGTPDIIRPETNPNTIAPSTVQANEVSAVFEDDPQHRRSFVVHRSEWLFELLMGFGREVSLEAFEESLMAEPPIIPADSTRGLPQITLILRECDYSHPPQSGGQTQVIYRFEARQGQR